MVLFGQTPAEQTGIKLKLGQNRIEGLIKIISKRENIVL